MDGGVLQRLHVRVPTLHKRFPFPSPDSPLMIRHLVSGPSLRRCRCSPSRGRGVRTASNHLRPPASMASPSASSAIAFSGGEGGGSRTNEPVSGAVSAPEAAAGEDAEYGFQRRGFGKGPLVGTVHQYDRHLFLCYKSPEVWPPNVEGSESDLLPRCLAGEIKTWQSSIDKKTRLTICQGEDGTDFSNGDVLIFPDMLRYRQLTHSDVEHFVDEVLKKNSKWLPNPPEPLSGSYVFVCAHGSRDRRCGVCGPVLMQRFKEEISSRGLQGQVFVSPCSHIGGHKYAGNVIIYSPNDNGEVSGHWYGYVTPDDVPILMEQHIGKGKIVDHLWRGQMGLSVDEQKAAQNLRLQLDGGLDESTHKGSTDTTGVSVGGCCQGVGNTTCCQVMPKENPENHIARVQEARDIAQKSSGKDSNADSSKEACTGKLHAMSTWFKSWEREDTYAALAVVSAIASVAVAYSYYRQLR